MTILLKLAILFVAYSDHISGAARPVPRASSLAASIFPRYSSVLALSTLIVSTSQPVLGQAKATVSIDVLETRSHPEQSGVDRQPADTAPCTTFTGNLGPNDEIGGTVNATKSTIASSQINGAATLDAAIGADTMAQRTSSSFVITPTPSTLERLWSISSEIAGEPTSTVTIMTITTRDGGAKETFSVSLPSNDFNSIGETTPSTLSSPMATTKTTTTTTTTTVTMTMTKEPAEMKCLYGRAATPGSIRYRRDHGRESDDIPQGQDGPSPQTDPCSPGPGPMKKATGGPSGGPSAGKSGSLWLNKIPSPHPLIQWFQCITVTLGAAYAFVKKVLGCRPQPLDPECGKTVKIGTSRVDDPESHAETLTKK